MTQRGKLPNIVVVAIARELAGFMWAMAQAVPISNTSSTSQWLDRQQAKLLPVEYFMVTFTLPYELRALVWRHQTTLYQLLFTTCQMSGCSIASMSAKASRP